MRLLRRMDRVSSFILCLAIVFLAGCTPPGPDADWAVKDLFEHGQRHMEKKNYVRAMEAYRIITLSHSTSDLVDDALFNLGETHRLLKEYPLAIVTYRRLIRDFPQSPYSDDAQYQMAVSIFNESSSVALTQDKTYEAIRELQIFVDEYPGSEVALQAQSLLQECLDKLAEKDYYVGHLYYKMKDWEAARLYFTEMLEEFPASPWAQLARYELAESYAREKKWEDAIVHYRVFLQLYPDHELAPRVDQRLEEVVAELARESPDTSVDAGGVKNTGDQVRQKMTDPRPADSATP